MSSYAKRMGKKITKNMFTFPGDMYFNTFGSYIVCSYILNGGDIQHVKKTWTKVKRDPAKYIDLTDPEWLQKLCTLFKVEYDVTGRIAFCEGKLNSLFCLVDEEGALHTTREDGWVPKTILDAVKAKKVKILVQEK